MDGGEDAGFVVLLGGLEVLPPGGLDRLLALEERRMRIAAARERRQHILAVKLQGRLQIRRRPECHGHLVVMARRPRVHQAVGFAHELGMVGDGHEVERALDLVQAAVNHDLLTLGEPIGVVGCQPVARDEGVHGNPGVNVLLSEIGFLQRILRNIVFCCLSHRRESGSGTKKANTQKMSRVGPIHR